MSIRSSHGTAGAPARSPSLCPNDPPYADPDGGERSLRSLTTGGPVILLIIGAVALWFGLVRDSDLLARNYAASQYGLPNGKIQIEGMRPRDCGFLSAPFGSKHCSYEREYLAEWITLSADSPPRPISYGTIQAKPPTACSTAGIDFAHRCYYTDLQPGERAISGWHARNVAIRWRKVEE